MKFTYIIFEGKKENLIDKYKENPSFVGSTEWLEKLIDGDPSQTKKYSEWLIKQVIGLGNPSSYSLPDTINMFIDLIEKFHKESNSITPEDIDLASNMSSLVNVDKIKTGPKDINKYDTIWALQAVLSAVSKRKTEKEKEESLKGETEKIYEDDRFLIVQPFSHGASCYYGAGTKWCTTTKGDTTYFDRYNQSGNLFYIIDKKSNNNIFGKMAIHISNDGGYEVFDQQDNMRSIDMVYERFEPIKDEIKKLIKGSSNYEEFKKILNGKKTPERIRLNSEIFDEIRKDGDDFIVYIYFKDIKDYLNLFSEQVDEWELDHIGNIIEPGYGYEFNFFDMYNWNDEISEGYYINNLNDKHLSKLKEIIYIYNPSISELIKETTNGYVVDRDDMSKIGNLMINFFNSSDIEELGYIYSYAYDEAVLSGLQKELNSDLCNALEEIGIKKSEPDSCFYSYKINLKTLIDLYEENDSTKGLTFDRLIKYYVEKRVGFPINDIHSMQYEYMDDELFNYHFNEQTLNALENIYSKIEESEYFTNFDEYIDILKKVEEEFGINKNIPVPTLDDVLINISGVDPETNKVLFTLKKLKKGTNFFETRKGKSKLSSVRSLMNNYMLFDPFE